MNSVFLSKIHIEKVRHLKNIDIELANDERKHLILTGKNGSGKTSLLNALAQYLGRSIEHNREWYTSKGSKGASITGSPFIRRELPNESGEGELKVIIDVSAHNMNTLLKNLRNPAGCIITRELFVGHLLSHMPADRSIDNEIKIPKMIETVDLEEATFADFLQYYLLLYFQELEAHRKGDSGKSERINKWFDMFKNALCKIYDCSSLDIVLDSEELSIKVKLPDREPFGFCEMAGGYSSLLYIVMELIMRMEGKASMTYDMPGIVFIDEVETHLHVELQRMVLPFLVEMFPCVQFIVTTHSPFVISSLPNAVVYDLERQIRIEDMSAYSYEGIIEHYYDVNQYSGKANEQFEKYQSLVDKENRSQDERKDFINALTYLRRIPDGAAQELVFAFREMEAERRGRYSNGEAE